MGKIVLTNKQKECVKHPPKNNLLVQGIAGSGKSLVLINRAAYLQNKAKELGGNVGIALFTYVNSLVRYTREVADTLGDDTSDINITTIDKQAFSCYRDMFGYTKIEYEFDRNLLDEITNRLAKNDSNRFLKPELRDFLVDEINWIKGRSIASSQEYENCIRYGRGSGKGSIRPSKAERQLIYQIFSRYDSTKKFMSPDDMYEKILANSESIPEKYKYDFVMLDESQDLSLNKLKYAKAVTRKSLTIAGDQNQKIYKCLDLIFFVFLCLTAMNFNAKFFYLAVFSTLILFVLQPKVRIDMTAFAYLALSILMSVYNLDEGILPVLRCLVYSLFYTFGIFHQQVKFHLSF